MKRTKDPIQELYDGMLEHGITMARQHHKPVHRYRASEAADCVRKIWYRLSGYRPSPRTPSSIVYGVCGDVDHDVTRQMLDHYGIKVGGITHEVDGAVTEILFAIREFVVQTEGGPIPVTLSARADGLIDTPRGDDCLLEIKGKGHWPFDWTQKAYRKDGYEGLEAYVKEKQKKDYWQTQVTMKLVDRTMAYLLYKDRSTGQLGIHNEETGEYTGIYIAFEEALFEEILQRFAYIEYRLEEGTPPVPEFAAGSRDCSWCPFRYLCHDAEDRRAAGKKPVIVYPGPQMEVHLEDGPVQSERDETEDWS